MPQAPASQTFDELVRFGLVWVLGIDVPFFGALPLCASKDALFGLALHQDFNPESRAGWQGVEIEI